MYKVRNLDAPRTMEDQMALLATAAREALDAWFHLTENREDLGQLRGFMQHLNSQLTETDVFMSGWLANRPLT